MFTLEDKILISMEKLVQIQRVLLWDVVKKEKISPMQAQFILFLHNNKEKCARVSTLAREFDLTKATVSDGVKALVKKGYVKTEKHPDDLRQHVLRLTEKGVELASRISCWNCVLKGVIEKFDEGVKRVLYESLYKIIDAFVEKKIISPKRHCLKCKNLRVMSDDRDGTKYYCTLLEKEMYFFDLNIDCPGFKD